MKRLGLLLAIAGVLCLEHGDPSEAQIQTAFASALENPLRGVRLAATEPGTDVLLPGGTTEIRALRKLGCVRAPLGAYVCDFFVELRAGSGESVRRTISGYFLDGPGPLTFAREIGAS